MDSTPSSVNDDGGGRALLSERLRAKLADSLRYRRPLRSGGAASATSGYTGNIMDPSHTLSTSRSPGGSVGDQLRAKEAKPDESVRRRRPLPRGGDASASGTVSGSSPDSGTSSGSSSENSRTSSGSSLGLAQSPDIVTSSSLSAFNMFGNAVLENTAEVAVPQAAEAAVPQAAEVAVPQAAEAAVPQAAEAAVPQAAEAAVPQAAEAAVPQAAEAAVPQAAEAAVPQAAEAAVPQAAEVAVSQASEAAIRIMVARASSLRNTGLELSRCLSRGEYYLNLIKKENEIISLLDLADLRTIVFYHYHCIKTEDLPKRTPSVVATSLTERMLYSNQTLGYELECAKRRIRFDCLACPPSIYSPFLVEMLYNTAMAWVLFEEYGYIDLNAVLGMTKRRLLSWKKNPQRAPF